MRRKRRKYPPELKAELGLEALRKESTMTGPRESAISFGSYIKLISIVVFSSTLILGLILGVTLLVVGEASTNFDIGLEFATFDGFVVMLGLPIFSVLVCVILSPLSFLIYRLLSKRKPENVPPAA